MAVLHFDKNELGNLEYSLQREMLSTNRAGGYMSTTIVCCNTRKYHGLMVCPKDDRDENNYVLLSSVDETVVQHEQSFNLAIHRFPGVYDPRGHKYITDFTYTPAPAITYRVGGVILKKELLWIHSRTQLLIRYTLLDARSQTQLRLRPFLAFRDRHTVGRANMEAEELKQSTKEEIERLYHDVYQHIDEVLAQLDRTISEKLTDIPEKIDFFDALPDYDAEFFTNKKSKTNPEVSKAMLEAAIPALEAISDWTADAIHDTLIDLAAKLEVKNATLMWPVRIAAAGKLVTPGGAVEICHLLGKDETLRRLCFGLAKLN